MFGWFRPTCPVDLGAKDWIEERLAWLSREFDCSDLVDKPTILPTQAFFPDPYDGSYASVRCMLDRVCQYMEVDPESVELKLFHDVQRVHLIDDGGDAVSLAAAGLYSADGSRSIIQINTAELHEPMSIVGTMAHELAHVRLMGEERVSGDEFDNELLTDLTTVFHGLGIFLANYSHAWPSKTKFWPGTRLIRPDYMNAPMYGYALAHIAWHRDQARPAWAKYLRSGPRANFQQGLRFLRRTQDSQFSPFWHKLG